MNDSEYVAAIAQNYANLHNNQCREHYARLMRISKKLKEVDNNETLPYHPEPNDWSLGEIDGNWIEIDHKDHSGVIRMVLKFEGEVHNEACQLRVYEVMSLLNSKSKPMIKYQHGDTYFSKDVLDRVNAELMKWQTGEKYLPIKRTEIPTPITASVVVDNGGEVSSYCVMSAYTSKKHAMTVLSLLTGGDE